MALAHTVDGIKSSVSREPRLELPRNPFSPFSRLPAEILANIFIHIAHDSHIREIYGDPNPATPSWVNVSYVCRHWRDIALNFQTLWTFIPTTSQRWTQELLARSQKAPLKICILDGLPQVLFIVEQLVNHSQRIQDLHLDLRDVIEECHHEIVSRFLSSPLPCLEHLEMSFFRLPDGGESLFLFGGNTPALRTLILENCRILFNSLGLGALTTLHLHAVQFLWPPNIIMAEFLGMLRRMPHLVHLYIHDSLPNTHDFLSSGQFSAAPMINLSRLSDMSIRAPISTVNALLSCVDIPLTTSVELHCMCGPPCDDFPRLASLLAQRINPSYDPTPAVPKFRSLIISESPMAMLAFSISERTPLWLYRSDENTRLLVHFQFVFDYARPSAIQSYMCRSIPLTSIRSVDFFEPVPDLDFWRDTLASFPNVRHIKLSGDNMPNIASILSLPSHNCSGDEDGPDDGDHNGIFVPALEELELCRITFSRVGDLDTLCEAISTRKETQCGLTIKKCSMATHGTSEALELIGRWEDSQFKITHP